jgi:hypothetical protein
MKLLVFGLTISSSWGNGHATLWRGLVRALAARGHSTVFFERDVPYYAGARDLAGIEGGRLVLYGDWEEARAIAERELPDAEVGIVTSYCPDGLAATDLVLDSGLASRVFYDLDTPVTLDALRAFANVDIAADNPRYRGPLESSARAIAQDIGADCKVVLLGSIASPKYVDVLQAIFGDRLVFPIDFVGRGDMSRGGLMLRAVDAGVELPYVPVAGAVRSGKRPPRLEPLKPR